MSRKRKFSLRKRLGSRFLASLIPTPGNLARAVSPKDHATPRWRRALGGDPVSKEPLALPPVGPYKMGFAGREIDVIVDTVAPNLIIPRSQYQEAEDKTVLKGLTPLAVSRAIAAEFPSTLWILTSIRTAITGAPRPEDSHAKGLAFDIGPAYSYKEAISPERKSPRLAQQLPSLFHLAATVAPKFPDITFVAEDDHFHIAPNIRTKGVVAQVKYHPGVYTNDSEILSGASHALGFTFAVTNKGGLDPQISPVRLALM